MDNHANLQEKRYGEHDPSFDSFNLDEANDTANFSMFLTQGNRENLHASASSSAPPRRSSLESSRMKGKRRKVEKLRPQLCMNLYNGLLSIPDREDKEKPYKCWRPFGVSNTVTDFAITDFISSTRLNRKQQDDIERVSVWEERLEQFRPFFEYSTNSFLDGSCQIFPDILSLTSNALQCPTQTQAENEACDDFAWDEEMGIAFKQILEPIVLIGYTVKEQPSSEQYAKKLCDRLGVLPIPLQSATTIQPCLYLEDGSARIRLNLTQQDKEKLRFHEIISGIPIAVKGCCIQGEFFVHDVMFATPLSRVVPLKNIQSDMDMIFVSDLRLGGNPSDSVGNVELLFEYLLGVCGSQAEQGRIMARNTRVFILGNLFPDATAWNREASEELLSAHIKTLAKIDRWISSLAETIEVFLIPGQNEPTHCKTVPQPPLHKKMFKQASEHPTFRCLTDPAKICLNVSHKVDFESENLLSLILTSGSNVREVMKSCKLTCPIKICSKLLEWSHLSPTSKTNAGVAEELLTVATLPHLFVVGGLSRFKLRTWNGVKMVGVPSFAKTGCAVMFRKNCDFKLMNFKC